MLLGAAPHTSSISTLYENVQRIERESDAGTTRLAALRLEYERGVPASLRMLDCDAIGSEQLEGLFLATHLLVLHAPETALLDRMICLHNAMDTTKLAKYFHHQKLHGAMVVLRKFSDANLLRLRYNLRVPELPALSTQEGSEPTALMVKDNGTVVAMPLLRPTGWQVIAVVHPHCAPSRRAMDQVMNSSESAWMLPHLKLLMPAGPDWLQKEMKEWNALHPGHPIAAELPGSSLEGVQTDETPVFYLMHDGGIVDVIRGWPEDPDAIERWRVRIAADKHER
jgi:hypothetical protein